MLKVFPDYYSKFKCIHSKCRHNCCVGWEIDIDPETAEYYKSLKGDFSQKINKCADLGENPHFILKDDERCPFLNRNNLCDIILNLGENRLCTICAEHPRFSNRLPGRIETGLGLCCEEAARIILTQKEPVNLCYSGRDDTDDPIINLRDRVIGVLQQRSLQLWQRIDRMLDMCYAPEPEKDMSVWANRLLKLERLDEAWSERLLLLTEYQNVDFDAFDRFMADRQTQYEQFAVYLVYRHLANAPDAQSVCARASFAAFGYALLRAIGACMWAKSGKFDTKDQIELARLFSSEIEYSDENLYTLLDEYL